MRTLKDIPIQLTPERVLEILSSRSNAPRFAAEMEKAVAMASHLCQPAAILQWVEVDAIEGEMVRLSSPDKARTVDLHIGPWADLLANAEKALVSVATIGPELDEQYRAALKAAVLAALTAPKEDQGR